MQAQFKAIKAFSTIAKEHLSRMKPMIGMEFTEAQHGKYYGCNIRVLRYTRGLFVLFILFGLFGLHDLLGLFGLSDLFGVWDY